ncbi:MAG: hypothetical protein ACE5JL_11585 [Dehalococcoidia bacterium]
MVRLENANKSFAVSPLVERKFQRPLPDVEKQKKAIRLLEEGLQDYEAAQEAEEELSIRQRGSVACEKVFHALVELTDALISRQVETHDDRVEALEEVGREDLADLYRIAKDALHTSGYYSQRLGPSQARTIQRVKQAMETELEKLR